MIRVGCSGYSYDDWHGPFYPRALPAAGRLAYYCQHFTTLELNATYYRQPAPAASARLAAAVGPDFRLAVKAWGGLTHDHPYATRADFRRFREGVAPLAEAGQLACVLAQFPQRFRPGPATEAFLGRLREEWPELPVCVEFRQASWQTDSWVERLAALGLGWCNVDAPDLRGLPAAGEVWTADPAYVRFHGRNAARWHEHEAAWERYDYRYQPAELAAWVPRIEHLAAVAGEVLVFFNNHYQAQAVLDARTLGAALGLESGGEEEVARE